MEQMNNGCIGSQPLAAFRCCQPHSCLWKAWKVLLLLLIVSCCQSGGLNYSGKKATKPSTTGRDKRKKQPVFQPLPKVKAEVPEQAFFVNAGSPAMEYCGCSKRATSCWLLGCCTLSTACGGVGTIACTVGQAGIIETILLGTTACLGCCCCEIIGFVGASCDRHLAAFNN